MSRGDGDSEDGGQRRAAMKTEFYSMRKSHQVGGDVTGRWGGGTDPASGSLRTQGSGKGHLTPFASIR